MEPRTEPHARPVTSEAVFRVLLSLIFLVAGTKHLADPGTIGARLEAAPYGHLATALAPAGPLVILAGIALVVGGVGLITGTMTRAAALLLIAVLIPITLTVQVSVASLGPLFKNVAILGGLIYFAVNGAHAWSVDALRAARARRQEPLASPAATG